MLKKVIITGMIAAILSFGTTFANAGIIILGKDSKTTTTSTATTSSLTSSDPCSGDSLVAAGTGIIILGLTGIIILGATDQPTTCGIIILG